MDISVHFLAFNFLNTLISMKGYIYKYTFPNGKVYIGQTRGEITKRHKQHMYASKYKLERTLCDEAIREYGEPLLEVIETVELNSEDETNFNEILNECENKWISFYDSENRERGYNVKRGGKREGAGRKALGHNTTPMCLKLDNDLYFAINSKELNKNRYINDAVRAAMLKDGFI